MFGEQVVAFCNSAQGLCCRAYALIQVYSCSCLSLKRSKASTLDDFRRRERLNSQHQECRNHSSVFWGAIRRTPAPCLHTILTAESILDGSCLGCCRSGPELELYSASWLQGWCRATCFQLPRCPTLPVESCMFNLQIAPLRALSAFRLHSTCFRNSCR